VSHHLVGVAEIADLLNVSRQRVNQLAATYPDFPQPDVVLISGRVWSREAIERWAVGHAGRGPGLPVPKTALGGRLRQLRVATGTTIEDLERLTGIPGSEYKRWENGLHDRPPQEPLVRLAELFGVHPGELLDAAGWGQEAKIARTLVPRPSGVTE
jgi:hypothetical protein